MHRPPQLQAFWCIRPHRRSRDQRRAEPARRWNAERQHPQQEPTPIRLDAQLGVISDHPKLLGRNLGRGQQGLPGRQTLGLHRLYDASAALSEEAPPVLEAPRRISAPQPDASDDSARAYAVTPTMGRRQQTIDRLAHGGLHELPGQGHRGGRPVSNPWITLVAAAGEAKTVIIRLSATFNNTTASRPDRQGHTPCRCQPPCPPCPPPAWDEWG